MMDARYDAIAQSYASAFGDGYDDPQTLALLELVGAVDGRRVLDLACGHGRISRELARRGAKVTGLDLSQQLIDKALEIERHEPLGIRYVNDDATTATSLAQDPPFDGVVCCFGLSDIDDLEGALANVARVLRAGGWFAFVILHPCFPGAPGVSASWPPDGSYYSEAFWRADGELSTLRRQVGANHRTMGTYFNTLIRHGLAVDRVSEPAPDTDWLARNPEASGLPLYLAVRCRRSETTSGQSPTDSLGLSDFT